MGALLLLPSGCTLSYWSAFCPNQRFPTELVLPAPEGAELVTASEGDYTARSFVFSTDRASSLDAVTAFAEHYEAKGWTASGEPIEGQLFTIDRTTRHISALLYSNVGGGQWTLDVSAADDQPGEVSVYVAVPDQSGLCA